MLLELGCFLAHPLRDDKACSSPDAVGVYAGKVPETRYLDLLRPLSVHAYGAVAHDEADLLGRGGVLQVLALLVQGDLLVEPGDLSLGGLVLSYPELDPDHIGDQDAHRLPCSSGSADGPCEHEVHVVGAVCVLPDLGVRYPFQGSDKDPLGEDCQSHPHGSVQGLLDALGGPLGHLLGHHQGDQLAVPELGG